jgi:hypothetical protein
MSNPCHPCVVGRVPGAVTLRDVERCRRWLDNAKRKQLERARDSRVPMLALCFYASGHRDGSKELRLPPRLLPTQEASRGTLVQSASLIRPRQADGPRALLENAAQFQGLVFHPFRAGSKGAGCLSPVVINDDQQRHCDASVKDHCSPHTHIHTQTHAYI